MCVLYNNHKKGLYIFYLISKSIFSLLTNQHEMNNNELSFVETAKQRMKKRANNIDNSHNNKSANAGRFLG